MINNYINDVYERNRLKKEKENYFFGLCFGIFLFLFSYSKFAVSGNNFDYDHYYIFGMIIGFIIILISVIYPNLLSFLKFILSLIVRFIGKVLFSIILSIIYFLFVSTFGIFLKKKYRKDFDNSTFCDYKYNNDIININKRSFIYQIFKLFKFFLNEKYIMLIPILIILIIIAVLLVVVQSNAIAPFIYTIF